MAETGWTNNLREAVNEMNNQPDISANDSPRLKELCRVTAMEIKAVGGVGAATSLEMIGYIRELERSQVGGDDYVAWCRYKHNSEGGIQSIITCDSNAKGAFKVYRASPSDFEQLTRLREAARNLLASLNDAVVFAPTVRIAADALRAVLDTELAQRNTGGK